MPMALFRTITIRVNPYRFSSAELASIYRNLGSAQAFLIFLPKEPFYLASERNFST